MNSRRSVQAIGECMVELVRDESGSITIGYSGDTYNTAVYLRRMAAELDVPIEVRYLSGTGDEAESRIMRARWRAEGIGDDALVVPGAAPGLYLIRTDRWGERSFTYWRADSAAARLFAGFDWIQHVDADLVYLSGITLQLMSEESREALLARLDVLRRRGTVVVFDSNYRPSAWPSPVIARAAMDSVLRLTDIALVTLDDEIALGCCLDVPGCVRHLTGLGVGEVAVKAGAHGAWVWADDELVHVPTQAVDPLDTTAAGDSFNGGYLAARLAGRSSVAAAQLGNEVARQVVQGRGAIVDLDLARVGVLQP